MSPATEPNPTSNNTLVRFPTLSTLFLPNPNPLTTPPLSLVQNLDYTGGTLHIIDSVLSIPGTVTDTLISGGLTAAAGALRRADIETPLNLASDVTVFAPTNDAFNAIGSTVNGMTLEQLTNVLNYHVIPGKVLYSQLMAMPGSATTQEGGNLNFRTNEGQLFVNGAKVLAADVLVGNGVVHVVDGYGTTPFFLLFCCGVSGVGSSLANVRQGLEPRQLDCHAGPVGRDTGSGLQWRIDYFWWCAVYVGSCHDDDEHGGCRPERQPQQRASHGG